MDNDQPTSYLVFISKASTLMSLADLTLILNQASTANHNANITGMLLYMEIRLIDKLEGRFIQLIEGKESDIQQLYKKIFSDRRHEFILILASGQCANRHFKNWAMSYTADQIFHAAYQTLDDKLFESTTFEEGKGPAYFLKAFYTYNRQLQHEYYVKTNDILMSRKIFEEPN